MTVKIKFVDFWPDFDTHDNFFTSLLRGSVDVEISDDPDFVFFSCFGSSHQGYPDAIRIFFTGENVRANRFDCDYSFGFDHDPGPRHHRWPLYHMYSRQPMDAGDRDKFCSIVVSNPNSPLRLSFFEQLHRRRPVDSGGRVRNNVGGPVESKLEFISKYRFNIAFENSSYPGYTTEKLIEAKNAGCIPIYWGDCRVAEELDENAFIDLNRFPSWEACIEHVLAVDADPVALRNYQQTSLFRRDRPSETDRNTALRAFLLEIVSKGTRRFKSPRLARWMAVWNRIHTRRVDSEVLSRWRGLLDAP